MAPVFSQDPGLPYKTARLKVSVPRVKKLNVVSAPLGLGEWTVRHLEFKVKEISVFKWPESLKDDLPPPSPPGPPATPTTALAKISTTPHPSFPQPPPSSLPCQAPQLPSPPMPLLSTHARAHALAALPSERSQGRGTSDRRRVSGPAGQAVPVVTQYVLFPGDSRLPQWLTNGRSVASEAPSHEGQVAPGCHCHRSAVTGATLTCPAMRLLRPPAPGSCPCRPSRRLLLTPCDRAFALQLFHPDVSGTVPGCSPPDGAPSLPLLTGPSRRPLVVVLAVPLLQEQLLVLLRKSPPGDLLLSLLLIAF
ncbi:wiskott-Aldrich syndrome protein homolog 1-like [Penaeus chinensis]|uniref:wiskott-Aldrich syndrome protein homolog 1-like n=1 Tax=Penaeus chinensis TaxID=139456 RepID=UPI001FB81C5E|nr:wiskott-Aldrich syndrome protein homolog 1-like [Penaeus chinensis]